MWWSCRCNINRLQSQQSVFKLNFIWQFSLLHYINTTAATHSLWHHAAAVMSRRRCDLRQRLQQLEVVVLDVVLHVVPEVHCRRENNWTSWVGHRGRECVASLTSDQRTHSLIQISAGDIIKYQLMELYSKTLFSLLVKQNQKHIYWCHFNQWVTNFIFFSLMIIFRILLKFVKSVSTWALLINDWDISCWCYRWSKEPKLYLRCSRVTAGRGGTTATADTASLRLSRCSGAAALSGTVGAGPGLGPGDPEGSTGPECGEGGVSLNCSVLNRAESAEIHRLTPERTFSESLWSTTSNSPLSRWR